MGIDMHKTDPAEQEMLKPVLRLFPKKRYNRYKEVPLGQKKIDLWCVPKKTESPRVCIELKVKDWKGALWQAIIDFQIAKESYIAIWHTYLPRVQKNEELLTQYGVGLICVKPKSANVIIQSRHKAKAIPREVKREFYAKLISV